jgi:hypothetical protein
VAERATQRSHPLFQPLFYLFIYFLYIVWTLFIYQWDLILTLHHHNNCTTTHHMRVDPSVWGPPSCEGLLCSCCIDVVNLTFFFWSYSISGRPKLPLWFLMGLCPPNVQRGPHCSKILRPKEQFLPGPTQRPTSSVREV